jgi:hypothetical protein
MGVSLKKKWLREQITGGKDRQRYHPMSQPYGSTGTQEKRL